MLWIKGETSGDFLDLVEVRVNCEQNSLLYLVRPRRTGACHTRDASGLTRVSCYYRKLLSVETGLEHMAGGSWPFTVPPMQPTDRSSKTARLQSSSLAAALREAPR